MLVAAGAIVVTLGVLGCSAEEEVVVVMMTVVSTTDLVHERVCLDEGGTYVLEAEAEAENMASGVLSIADGSEEGEYVTLALRSAGQPRRVRSEEVELQAGDPCYLVSALTGIVSERATTRLISVR